MSVYTYGACAKKREIARKKESTKDDPPGLSTTVDALIAIVPVEVVGIHAFAVTFLSDKWTLRGIYIFCIVLCLALFVVGHLTADPDVAGLSLLQHPSNFLRRPHPLDGLRIALPVFAFVAWTMLNKETAWDEIFPNMQMEARYFWGLILAGFVLLAAQFSGLYENAIERDANRGETARPAEPPL
jgi:hypothetical protein